MRSEDRRYNHVCRHARLLLMVLSWSLLLPTVHARMEPPATHPENKPELFTEVAEQVGIRFTHFNGMSGEYYYPEVVGSGCGFFDYDNDGDLDVYLVQGNMLGPGKTLAEAFFPPSPDEALTDHLFRNELIVTQHGTRRLSFSDVTEQSKLQTSGYGIGVSAGDYNNDGWTDLYVSNFGPNQLLRNNGDGTFTDVTREAGVDDPRLSVIAAFFDYDQDGWLDLYVVNHLEFDFEKHKPCSSPIRPQEYCSTRMYPALPGRLFRNLANGSFEDVTTKSHVDREYGAGLGIVTADLNGDGWLDIYVANDGSPNQLWINRKDGTFRNEALLAGAAVNMDGAAEASMGIDAGDFDEDGDLDLFMTHDLNETNTIYINDGKGWFDDRSVSVGLAAPSQGYTAFGTAWFDYNNDGWLDLFIANGAVRANAEHSSVRQKYPLDQTNQLFANLGNGRFKETTHEAGSTFTLSEVSRGAAFGDVDNDGDMDILLANNSGPARLLINNVGNKKPWLGLRLVDRFNRDALGATVHVTGISGRKFWRRVRTDGSYASANDPRILLGLGDNQGVRAVRVYWPGGRVEEWRDLPIGRYTVLREGSGVTTKRTKPD